MMSPLSSAESGQSIFPQSYRRLLRHNAIEAWETMRKSGGWKTT